MWSVAFLVVQDAEAASRLGMYMIALHLQSVVIQWSLSNLH